MEIKKIITHPKVIFEDNHLLLINKPPSMPVVPDSSKDYSLLEWGKDYLKHSRNKHGNVFLAVIHRIDRPVSGLVCFATTSKAASRLSAQLREQRVKKQYLAISKERPDGFSGMIKNYLMKDRKRNLARISAKGEAGSKYSVTKWQLLAYKQGFGGFLLKPVTGRPHQLRIHMAMLGCPIFGDFKYGSKEKFLEGRGIALHSYKITFSHPTKRDVVTFTAVPPDCAPFTLFDIQE